MNQRAAAVGQQIAEHGLFGQKERILAGVSGGADSMVLLHLLHRLAPAYEWYLGAAHLNHQLRGAAADEDEDLVRAFAEKLGLAFHAGKQDARAFSSASSVSVEMGARELRHRFLAETALAHNYSCVALGHHLDDQVELFFLRLLRGASNEGMAGMRWQSASPEDPRVRLARPLLGQTRAWILDYAREERVPFREDSSNADLEIPRNRIRRSLIPLLEEWQPAVRQSVARLMEIAGAEAWLSESMAREWLQGDRKTEFEALPVAVSRRCVELQLIGLGVEVDFDLVESLRRNPGEKICARGGRAVARTPEGDVREDPPESKDFNPASAPLSLEENSGLAVFDGMEISWRRRSGDLEPPLDGRSSGVEQFDSERVGRRVELRHWRPGDRFQPIGMERPQKLQNLFVNLKVPAAERRRRAVAVTAEGRIFWVEGLRIGEEFKCVPGGKPRLEWRWRRAKTTIAG